MSINSMYIFFTKILSLLTKKHKILFVVFMLTTIVLSIIETVGVSIIMPFISVASNPGLLDSGIYQKVYLFLNFNNKIIFIMWFGIFIIVFNIFRALYNIVHVYFIKKYSHSIYKYFANNLFKTYLTIPYKIYVQKNTAEFTQILTREARNLGDLLYFLLLLFSELFTIIFLYIFMLVFSFFTTLALTGILLISVIIIINTIIRTTKSYGVRRQHAENKFFRILAESFGNIKYLRLKGNEKTVIGSFNSSINSYMSAETTTSTLEIVPRFALESIGFSLLIAMVLFIIGNSNAPETVMPIVSMYALGLYRILPSVHKSLSNINRIVYYHGSLEIVHDTINQKTETEGIASIDFNNSICLKNVCFSYANGVEVLRDISLEIKKGEKTAVVGESGSGKSTLIDVITGIHKPDSGHIYIDNQELTRDNVRSWKSKIGYIPQNIYLFDGTVAENVALGSTPDNKRIRQVLEMANIWDFLSQKDGFNTPVGDGGIQLSGGQKQRIGIARALYDDPAIIILDEATSSLDNETESKIMDEIYKIGIDKTLIIIAHRLSTVEKCGRIIELEKGTLKNDTGNYSKGI